jgi:hypothetical protein
MNFLYLPLGCFLPTLERLHFLIAWIRQRAVFWNKRGRHMVQARRWCHSELMRAYLVAILNEMSVESLRHILHHEVWIMPWLLLLMGDTVMRLLIILSSLLLILTTVTHSCIHLRLVRERLNLSFVLHWHLWLLLMHNTLTLVKGLLFIPVYIRLLHV